MLPRPMFERPLMLVSLKTIPSLLYLPAFSFVPKLAGFIEVHVLCLDLIYFTGKNNGMFPGFVMFWHT